MKILHCCLANFFIDNFGYQENILTRIHKQQGHDVKIIASTEIIDPSKGIVYTSPSTYINDDGITIIRLPYINYLPHKIACKLRIYKGLYKCIEDFTPDIIFMHDAQTFAVLPIVSYIKKHGNVKLYIDSHTDFINSARSWISKNILHGILYKKLVRYTIPYTTRYYGTLPTRVCFYRDFYGTPKQITEYLPIGIDDNNIDFSKRNSFRLQIRKELNIDENDFVLITGGKIELRKNIHILLEAFTKIPKKNLKMILFGSISDSIRKSIETLIKKDARIIYIGWIPSKETYKYFFASDLACFVGTHSTLWEESVGYGIPGVFKYWDGITQIDRGGNCVLIKDVNVVNVYNTLCDIISNKETYLKLKEKALSPQIMEYFFYSKIAKYSIERL